MNRLIARPVRYARLAATAAALASTLAMAAPLAAQQTFSLPPASPAPTPAPAGPSDERAGVAIPPRAAPTARPSATPTRPAAATPTATPPPAPTATPLPAPRQSAPPPPRASVPSATAAPPAATPVPGPVAAPPETLPETLPTGAPLPAASGAALPLASAPADADAAQAAPLGALPQLPLPEWWPFAAGGLGALVLLGAGALLWRRRKAKPLRLAAPVAGASPAAPVPAAQEPPRLDLTLEITSATRSLMMFTLEYRLTIANRSERAVGDLHTAVELACARASAAAGGRAAPSAGAAQALGGLARIGPHQARSVTGTLQLPLTAIAPLRQGQTPLFVPLVHVTLEGESLAAQARTFVIGTPSPSGRVHPIKLDTPPGGITGLVAQAVAAHPASAAA